MAIEYSRHPRLTGLTRKFNWVPTPVPFIGQERYFRRNEGTTDYVSFPLVSTSTNCEISFDVYADLSGIFYVFGNSGNFNSRISIQADGSFGIRTSTDTSAFTAPSGTIPANTFTSIRIRLIGNNLEVFVNGVSIGTNGTGGGFNINQLFRNDVTVNGKGIIANFKITDNGVLVRDYPMDDNSDILRNRVAVLGAELSQINMPVQKLTDDNLILSPVISVIAGVQYLITIDVDNTQVVSTPSFTLNGSTLLQLSGTTNGIVQALFTLGVSGDFPLTLQGPASRTLIRSISIRQADNYGTVINGTADQWGAFQQQVDNNYIGQALDVPPWDSVNQELAVA